MFADIWFVKRGVTFCGFQVEASAVSMLVRWALATGYGVEVEVVEPAYTDLTA